MSIKAYLDKHPGVKSKLHSMMIHPVECRPRMWLRLLRPFYTHCAWSSCIHYSARMDVVPFHQFILGKRSVVESFSCVNNAVGDVIVGENTRIGLHNTVIGPVKIGNDVNIAQGVVLSGLNHGFNNTDIKISEQPVTTSQIEIGNDVWIGANCVITAGVHIGNHVVIGAGSVVTKDIPSHSMALGSPAKVIKQI